MKNVRTFAAVCATVFAATMAFAGGEGCKEGADKGACCQAGKDVAAKCAGGAETAKGGAEDAAKGEGYGIGQKPPTIELTDSVSGSSALVVDDKAAATVVIFWNQGCPFVVEAQDRVSAFAKEMAAKNVRVVAIDANDPGKANSADKVKEYASTRPFPVLLNPDSSVALNFGASRTPEAFVLDKGGVVQYHGAFDGGAKDPAKTFVADAVTAVLDGKTPAVTESKAFGCTIKFSDKAEKQALRSANKAIKVEGKKMEAAAHKDAKVKAKLAVEAGAQTEAAQEITQPK